MDNSTGTGFGETPMRASDYQSIKNRWLGIENRGLQIRSDEPDIPFDRFDHRVHLSTQYLLGNAKGEACRRVERNV
jgi:hypothetical protein